MCIQELGSEQPVFGTCPRPGAGLVIATRFSTKCSAEFPEWELLGLMLRRLAACDSQCKLAIDRAGDQPGQLRDVRLTTRQGSSLFRTMKR
eukprot:299228-Alexandrium_andersonii.AAC.1